MTRDDIVKMAQEAAIMPPNWGATENQWRSLHAFAELVRADERNRTWTQEHWTEYERSIAAAEREACAYRAGIALLGADRGLANRVDQAIRARGQA
jgi:hypothetical protein